MNDQLRTWSEDEQSAGASFANPWQDFFAERQVGPGERAEQLEAIGRAVEVQQAYEAELLARDNVVGVAPAHKVTAGEPTTTMSLTVLVTRKVALAELPEEARVPGEVDGVPTDVVETGPIEALVFNGRVRPALPGFSIGHHNITAGTFGCLVRDLRRCCCGPQKDCRCTAMREECPGDYLILSNNHVLADVNAAKPGDLILQPGPFDGGLFPSDGIAALDRFEPIVFGSAGYNLVDAAVARPTYSRNVTAAIIGQVVPRGVDQAFVGDRVVKAGRTTQITFGNVLSTNATIAVGYGAAGAAVFRHQILTTAMAAGGDSGSLLMNRDLEAVGLLFAGSAKVTIHNHISDVEATLGVRPLTAPTTG